jgi:hypothetical protein
MSRGVTTAVLVCLALLLLCAVPQPAAAEIRFRCGTGDPSMECAFSVEHPGGAGRTNFVLSGTQERALSDSLAGGRYCVVVDRKGQASVRDFPPNCKDGSGGAGRLQPIRAGQVNN